MVERLAWTLIHFGWQGLVVAAALAAALRLADRTTSAFRYLIACAALALMATAPVLTYLALAPAPDLTIADAITGTAVWSPGTAFVGEVASADRRLLIVVAAWAAGVVLLSLRLLGSLVRLARWRRRYAQAAPADWQDRIRSLGRRLGLGRSVTLLVSDRLMVPSAWGVLRPLIVVPASLLSGLPPDQVDTILLHELAHVRRHDYLVNLLQSVVETVLFYHPAVWWVSSIVRLERERCCDDVVVRLTADPMPYARALLYLEERRQTLPRLALSVKGTPLMNRIARILGNPPAPSRFSPLTSTMAALAVLGVSLGGVYEANAQSATPAKPKPAVHKSTPARKSVTSTTKSLAELSRVRARREQLEAQARIQKIQTKELAQTRALLAATQTELNALRVQIAASEKRSLAISAASTDEKAHILDAKKASIAAVSPMPASGAPEADAEEIGNSVGINSDNTHFFIDVKNGGFPAVMRRLAQVANLEVVIASGVYNNVTIYVNMRTPEDLVTILCKAGNATYRKEGNIYFFVPKATLAVSPAGGAKAAIKN